MPWRLKRADARSHTNAVPVIPSYELAADREQYRVTRRVQAVLRGRTCIEQ